VAAPSPVEIIKGKHAHHHAAVVHQNGRSPIAVVLDDGFVTGLSLFVKSFMCRFAIAVFFTMPNSLAGMASRETRYWFWPLQCPARESPKERPNWLRSAES